MTVITILAMLAGLVFLLPFLWGISLSLRPPIMTFVGSGMGIPFVSFEPSFGAWRELLAEGRVQPALARSTGVSLAATLLALLLGVPAAYALARSRTPRGDLLVIGFLLVRLLPPVLIAVALYPVFHALGLVDGWPGLVLVNAALLLPFVIAILRQAFRDLPLELEEAAALDGAGATRTLFSVVLPLSTPAIAATGLILFAFAWNDYLFALAFFVSEFTTMPLLVQAAGSAGPWGAVSMLTAMTVPVILAVAAQRYLVRGLTLGAVKG